MQRKKLGTAVVWMVCLLGMVAVVWSRPPLGGSRESRPTLALAAPREAAPVVQTPVAKPEPIQVALDSPPAQPQVVQHLPNQTPQGFPTELSALPTQQWVRELSPFKAELNFEGNRFKAHFTGTIDGERSIEFRMAADYHLTKDSIAYGIITSAEILLETKEIEEKIEADLLAQKFLDQPFALRYRLDEEAFTIKDVKIGAVSDQLDPSTELTTLIIGRYVPVEPAAAPQ